MSAHFDYTIFSVDDVESTLDFFTASFDFPRRLLTPEGDYGELETGQTTLAFASNALMSTNLEQAGGFARLSAAQAPVGATITLTTEDVEATVERALTNGATRYGTTDDKPWGQTVAYLRDGNGILLEIATPIRPATTGPR
jgi:lactoylglutathione lyase